MFIRKEEDAVSEVWLGLDVGTTAIKAAAYGPDGAVVATAEVATKVLRGPDGETEQDMDAVWQGVVDCLSSATSQCAGHTITSLGLAAQGDGCWALDKNGDPVRNAILWSDTRGQAVKDLSSLEASGALRTVGLGCNTALWPGTSALGWRWIRQNDPDAAARTAHVVTCGDFIGMRLTGQIATDLSNATIPFLDLQTQSYGGAVSVLDCNDLQNRLPKPRRATEVLGHVADHVANATGLPHELPVSVATLDLGAMIVGMGLAQSGETMMIMGTTAVVNILTDSVIPTGDPLAATVMHPTRDNLIRVLAPTTGAAAFEWFASLHPQSLGGETAGEVAEKLNTLVEDVPIGSNGVTFLPYLNGERAPFVSPDIRASFLGMSAGTTKGELGRAVMEGTALSLRHCCVSEGGLPSAPVQLTGGGARNPVWCQIIADVIGQDILVNSASDLGLWGAACIGASAVSGDDPIALAARDETLVRYACNLENHAAYGAVFNRYQMLSDALRAIPPQ
jgi:sugar (pentulose or hexulose) kinase